MMMKRTILAVAMLAGTTGQMLAITPLTAEALFAAASDDPRYLEGTKAMNEQRWQDAVVAFDKVIGTKGKKTDAAIYWKAYSLRKLGDVSAAGAACDQLRAQFKGSSWNRDCATLTLDTAMVRPGSDRPIDSISIRQADPMGGKVAPGRPSRRDEGDGFPGGEGGRDPNDELKL